MRTLVVVCLTNFNTCILSRVFNSNCKNFNDIIMNYLLNRFSPRLASTPERRTNRPRCNAHAIPCVTQKDLIKSGSSNVDNTDSNDHSIPSAHRKLKAFDIREGWNEIRYEGAALCSFAIIISTQVTIQTQNLH